MTDKNFAQTIKSTRDAKGMTQTQLGDLIGVTTAYISSIENKKKMPPPYATTALLAQALELDVDELWEIAQAEREQYKRQSEDRKKAALQVAFVKEGLSDFEREILKEVRATKQEDQPFILRFLKNLTSDKS
jgi:transcriptional regulator with XRE-family HTH domain